MTTRPFPTLDADTLISTTGGMQWQRFPESANIEDRRSPAAIQRGQQLWNEVKDPPRPTTGADPLALPPLRTNPIE